MGDREAEKWAAECVQVKRFLATGAFPVSGVLQQGTNPPDFVIESDGLAIALEHTLILHPPDTRDRSLTRAAHEGLTRGILGDAEAIWTDEARPHVEAWVHFNYPLHMTSRERTELARAIVGTLASSSDLLERPRTTVEFRAEASQRTAGVRLITAVHSPKLSRTRISEVQAAYVPPLYGSQ